MTIREILAEHKISQVTLAEMLNISINTIGMWCRGLREPPEYVVTLIAYYLDRELGVPASRSAAQNNQTK